MRLNFLNNKEIITLNHESFDRALYSEGALVASKWLMKKKPGLYSMRDLLNFKVNSKKKSLIIQRILNETYPKIPIPLNYKNTFTLLISVLLSAQCTDVNVNNVTKKIYPKYNQPKHFVRLGRKK